MVSAFHGLEMAKRALNAQQAALYTTSHNISNANTVGYTRQRVNFGQLNSLSTSREPGGVVHGVGSGVEAGSIQRIRDQFLDTQFRKENSKLGYYDTRAVALRQMENLLNEPTEEGLAFVMENFFNSLQDLTGSADHSGTRTVVAQRAEAVVETFRYLSNSMQDVQDDLHNQINVTAIDFNSILSQISAINNEIAGIEPHGLVPNDLYDERDRLIDELSEMVDIEVTYEQSSGQPNPIAEGIASITLRNGSQRVNLVDGATRSHSEIEILSDDGNISQINIVNGDIENSTINAAEFESIGTLRALFEMNGYTDGVEVFGYYNDVRADLELMLDTYASEFNRVHAEGFDLFGNEGEDVVDFFVFTEGNALETIEVNPLILADPDLIAASLDGFSGDGTNALNLAGVYDTQGLGELGERTSVKSFYQSLIGELGVRTNEANTMRDNSDVLRQQVEENRMSVSSVSIDEEITNLIKFQHAYNAAARSMTAVDEMLDRMINNMGLVGR